MTLDATIEPEAAARRVWDAIVVGAGPAGAMAAREVARHGGSVLLVDRARFPRYKVCGGCLNPRALRVLARAGLGELTNDLGAVRLTNLRLGAGGRYADIAIPTGAGVSREGFDVALIQAAIAVRVGFLPGTTAAVLPSTGTGERRTVRLRQAGRDHAVEGRVVLAASGLGSKIEEDDEPPDAHARPWQAGSRVGAGVLVPAGRGYEPRTIYMACGADGYVGQSFVEDGRLDVAAALDPLAVKRAGGTGELAARILEEAGFPTPPGLADLAWKGTPHLTRQAPRLGGERLFVLGDAAGYVEPFTGEGMAWALAGAAVVAPLALRAARGGWDPELLVSWRGAYRRSVTCRQTVCRITADLLRRPTTTRVLVRALGVASWFARPVLWYMYRD